MRAVRIQRYPRRRGPTCGCGVIAGVISVLVLIIGGYLLLTTSLLGVVVLELTGAQRIGSTDSVFVSASPAPVVNPAPAQVTVDLGSYGQEIINVDGLTIDPSGGATLRLTEASAMRLCDRGFCGDVRVDFRPGGAVISAVVNTQRIGVVVRLDESGRFFSVMGVDVGGILYDPESIPGEVSGFVREVERVGNDALGQLAIRTAGSRYDVSEIYVDDAALTLVLE